MAVFGRRRRGKMAGNGGKGAQKSRRFPIFSGVGGGFFAGCWIFCRFGGIFGKIFKKFKKFGKFGFFCGIMGNRFLQGKGHY